MLEFFPVTAKAPLILASNSPRRRQLLALTGIPFIVLVADVDESLLANENPAAYVLRLAEAKARAVSADAGQIILAADTTVDSLLALDREVRAAGAHAGAGAGVHVKVSEQHELWPL